MYRLLLLPALLLPLAACGDDDDAGDPGAGGTGGTGTIAVHLEEVDGVFIEGFEVGLRFETGDGEVVASTLWTDFVASTGDESIDAYYDSVLEQPMPAGPAVVRAEVVQSIGGPITPPDLDGDLPCRLEVDVPAGGTVEVEVSFAGGAGCLSVTP